MTFREGLLCIYKNRQTDGEITDPFYLYCRLSDLASSSYEDKKKVKLLQTKSVFENAVRNFELGGSTCKKVFSKCIEQEKTDGVAKYYLGQITVDKEL